MVSFLGKTVALNKPSIEESLPTSLLTNSELQDVSIREFKKKKLLYVIPSIDTNVCLSSSQKLNRELKSIPSVMLYLVSADLPFALKRIIKDQNLDKVRGFSTMRSSFGRDFGLEIKTGPLKGLLTRALFVLDDDNNIIYTELVEEITKEPDYAKALKVLRDLIK